MSKTPSMAHVYVFASETGLIKIGHTMNPQERVRKIQMYSGFKITRQSVSPLCSNYREVEKSLHKQFASDRYEGEWFAVDFQTAVEALNQQISEIPSSNQLMTFYYEQSEVRTITFDGEGNPWFVANDVCKILDIKNPRDAVSRLDDDERMTVVITDGLIKQGFSSNAPGTLLNLVNEYGLYALILSSRKAEAKRFKRWIIHEVLPAIRKTGKYEINRAALPPTRRPEYQDFDRFVNDRFVPDSAGLVNAGNIYVAYKDWCQYQQRPVYSHKLLGQYLKEMGYTPAKRTHGKYFWLGIHLRLQSEKTSVEANLLCSAQLTDLRNGLSLLYKVVAEKSEQLSKDELLILIKCSLEKIKELS